MKFDFLSLLESIVHGFVAFVYSVARSLYAILRRPVRGPLRLYGRYRIPHHRQIGGVTFLYLGFFVTLYLVFKSLDFTSVAIFGAIWDAIVALPTISQDDLWPILAGSLIGTTIIDAALRLWLARRVRRRSRREMLIAAAEYSLFLAVAPAGFLGWYAAVYRCPETLPFLPGWAFATPPLVLLASIAAGFILRMAIAERGSAGESMPNSRAVSAKAVLLLAPTVAALVALAGFAAVQLAVAIGDRADVCYIP